MQRHQIFYLCFFLSLGGVFAVRGEWLSLACLAAGFAIVRVWAP